MLKGKKSHENKKKEKLYIFDECISGTAMTGGSNTTFTSTGGISTSMTGGSVTTTGVPVLTNSVRQYLKTDKSLCLYV